MQSQPFDTFMQDEMSWLHAVSQLMLRCKQIQNDQEDFELWHSMALR